MDDVTQGRRVLIVDDEPMVRAKRIVESLGGEIQVQSEPARGSRFAIHLPDL